MLPSQTLYSLHSNIIVMPPLKLGCTVWLSMTELIVTTSEEMPSGLFYLLSTSPAVPPHFEAKLHPGIDAILAQPQEQQLERGTELASEETEKAKRYRDKCAINSDLKSVIIKSEKLTDLKCTKEK